MPDNNAPLTIWCNHRLTPASQAILSQRIGPHRLLLAARPGASNLVTSAPDPQVQQAQVIFGQPDVATFLSLPLLRWVHLTSAGYERYDTPDIREGVRRRGLIMTNSSSVYDEPCAEHAFAMMLALARQLPAALDIQRGDRSWPSGPLRAQCRLMLGQTVVILGLGAIARRLVELLAPFHMTVIAVRRTVKGDEGVRTVSETQVESVLPLAAHVVNTLPGGEATAGFVSAARIALMKPTAIFYNVGRGSTVDQDALQAALETRRLAAAYLDVMKPEPLPPQHPLWKLPNCFITPHSAGGHDTEQERQVEHFLTNLDLFTHGKAMRDRIME